MRSAIVIRSIINFSRREAPAIHDPKLSWRSRLRLRWRSPLYQLKVVLLVLLCLACFGTLFYRLVLGWGLRSAILQVVLYITTLGGEAHQSAHSSLEEWFKIGFIITFLLVGVWALSLLAEAIVRGEFVYYWGRRRMEQRIAKLTKHYIICGFGRMGQEIARQLDRTKLPVVVVEHNPTQLPVLEASEYLHVSGDAREDEHLLAAGIERAKGLIAVASSDEENVYITLSARVLNPDIYIVTRCSHASGEEKLLRAGADRVFSPYIIGGRRMAQAVQRPMVVDFLDTIVHGEQMELVLEEIVLDARAPIHGRTLEEIDIEKMGVHLLGVSTRDGQMRMRDLGDYRVQDGDTLILLGDPAAMSQIFLQLTGKDHVPTRMAHMQVMR